MASCGAVSRAVGPCQVAWPLAPPPLGRLRAAAIAGAVGNVVKQNRLYPVPKGGPDSPPDEKKQGKPPPHALPAALAPLAPAGGGGVMERR